MLPHTSPASISSFSAAFYYLLPITISEATSGRFEDLVWADFTCRPIYEERRCDAVHSSIPSSLTGALSGVCLSWIGNGSHLVAWNERAGLDRMSSVYMSGSLGRDSLPSLLLLPAITFDPPCLPLHPHPISLGWDGGQKKPAGGFASVRESACRWSYDACRPFVQQAVRPPPGSNCQVRDQTSVEAIFTFISHPHCTIGRFPLQLPVWASVQITVTV